MRKWFQLNESLLDEDNKDNEPVRSRCTRWFPITLTKLFNFEHAFWKDRFMKEGSTFLDDELAVYEWLELNAQGEEMEEMEPDTEEYIFS